VPRIVVIGGGISGLSVAYQLVREGAATAMDVRVLEQSDRPGGNLCSERVDGFLCEGGPNGFLDNAPDTAALVKDLGLETIKSDGRARRRYIYRHGRLHEVPGSPVRFLRSPLLSWRGKLRVLCEPLVAERPAVDETIHQFAVRRLGKEAADALVDPMVSGVFGGDAAQLSLRACFPVMWALEAEHGGLFRALWARRRNRRDAGASNGSPLGRLTSFADGIETLPASLAKALGARVQMSRRVIAIARQLGEEQDARPPWRVMVEHGAPLYADQVVMAGSPSSAARLIAPLDPALASTLDEIPSAPIAVIALGYRDASIGHPLDGFGFLAPRSEGLRSLGVLWESSIFPERAPGGHFLVRVMIGGAHDPAAVRLDDDALAGIARNELQIAMGIAVPPAMTHVVRHGVGIPQYTTGHLDRLKRIDEGLGRWPGLHLTGNGYRGVSINNCITDAKAVAARVLGSDAVKNVLHTTL
jgi:oxygen-dependent protoporphyrinogen oxidase